MAQSLAQCTYKTTHTPQKAEWPQEAWGFEKFFILNITTDGEWLTWKLIHGHTAVYSTNFSCLFLKCCAWDWMLFLSSLVCLSCVLSNYLDVSFMMWRFIMCWHTLLLPPTLSSSSGVFFSFFSLIWNHWCKYNTKWALWLCITTHTRHTKAFRAETKPFLLTNNCADPADGCPSGVVRQVWGQETGLWYMPPFLKTKRMSALRVHLRLGFLSHVASLLLISGILSTRGYFLCHGSNGLPQFAILRIFQHFRNNY